MKQARAEARLREIHQEARKAMVCTLELGDLLLFRGSDAARAELRDVDAKLNRILELCSLGDETA